jgi:inner membrane protease subunit 1
MLPSFDIYGTRALCSRLHRRGKDVEVGDLIDYRIPIFTGVNGIKRVIGMPGDYVLVDSPDSGSQEMIQVSRAMHDPEGFTASLKPG